MTAHELWYPSQADEWTEALPLGNGRLGAMAYGRHVRDEYQLNEDTLWSGGPYNPVNPDAQSHLSRVRDLIFSGHYEEAERETDKHLMARPFLQTAYQPAGRLLIESRFTSPAKYRERRLDLRTAVASLKFRADEVEYERESFISAADDVLIIRMTASRPEAFNFSLSFISEQPGETTASGTSLQFNGRNRSDNGIASALLWGMEARVIAKGGSVNVEGATLDITSADEVTIFVDVRTSFRRFDDVSGDPQDLLKSGLDQALSKSYAQLKADHIRAHQALYNRFSLDLGSTPAAALPTNRRIASFNASDDPELAALYVHFGRYLAICSSRPGTQPANLQGIWNKEIRPPWGSKYTANINLQMNYWLADPANLTDCFEPLIKMVEELAITGAETARVNYGARGWVIHHNADLWRATGPIDGARFGMWPTCGAWLCAQLWDHARYAGYPQHLVERIYPLMVGACHFFSDTLVNLPNTDLLVTVPSVSPENQHPFGTSVCAGPAMDNQLLRDLFAATIDAASRLNRDADLVAEITTLRDRLPSDKIGAQGQLQEWLEDWDAAAPEIDHRHVSHLYAVYPSLQIEPRKEPSLAAAARKSLEIRGDDATGWGLGWRINLWARLGDGNHAYTVLRRLLHPERTYPNLLDAHPPFQIDGNFGGAAGILEMLAYSNDDQIRLLPALPDTWRSGSVSGLRVRSGITLDFAWSEGKVTSFTAHSFQDYAGQILADDIVLADGLAAGYSTCTSAPTARFPTAAELTP